MLGRAWFLAFCFSLLVAVLTARLFQLQILRGDRYAEDVAQSRLSVDYVPARRGRILDRYGEALVDNRAVYDVAVVLSRLELTRRERRSLPFYRFDQAATNQLVSDLSARTLVEPDQVREIVIGGMERFPSTAVRQGDRVADGDPGLLALPQAVFVDAAHALSRAQEEERPGLARRIDPKLAELAESGLLQDDPREALEREFELLRGSGALVLGHDELRAMMALLAAEWAVPAEMLSAVLEPFAPEVTLEDPVEDVPDGETATPRSWRILAAERRHQAEEAIARFTAKPVQDIRQAVRDAARRVRQPTAPDPWFYVPLAQTEALAALLPDEVEARVLSLAGAPANRERILLVQGDGPEGDGMFGLLCARLAASLDMEAEQIGFIIRRHGERVSIPRMERAYRVHLLALDRQRLERLVTNLAAIYRSTGLGGALFEIEEGLTAARRTADREWRGSTRHDPIVIERDIPRQVAVDLAGAGAEVPGDDPIAEGFVATEPLLPGLRIVSHIGRDYPHPGTASHLIGWLGRLSAQMDRRSALSLGLDPQGWTGTRGLEDRYDEILQGVVGRRVRLRTPTGWKALPDEAREPVAGTDLVTTLDLELQLAVEDALGRWLQLAQDLGTIPPGTEDEVLAAQDIGKGRAGMAVIDCRTGGILALASTPGFDLGQVRKRYEELIDPEQSPGKPLHDHATWASQPPGSTIKPLVAIAALKEGVYRPGEVVHTEGYMARWRGRPILGDHPPVPRDWTMKRAITKSSNTFFATMGEELGPHKLTAWMRRFGLGQRSAVDVSWMRPGLLPTPQTITRTRPAEPHWLKADTWRLAIGQFVTASPLQVAPIAACVGNGGTILRPHLWHAAADEAVAEELDLSPAMLAILQDGMVAVTEPGGTAPWLRLRSGIEVAAKTGTSEWGSQDSRRAGLTPDNGWLMGYAPADNPQVAFAIYVHAAGMSGGRACSGVAKQVLDTWFEQQARRAAAADGR